MNGKRLVAKMVKRVTKGQSIIKPAVSNECNTENMITETVANDNQYSEYLMYALYLCDV